MRDDLVVGDPEARLRELADAANYRVGGGWIASTIARLERDGALSSGEEPLLAYSGSRQSATTAAIPVFWVITTTHIATYDSSFGGFRHTWKLYPLAAAQVSRFENQVTVWARRMRPRSIIFGHQVNRDEQHELAQAHAVSDVLNRLITTARATTRDRSAADQPSAATAPAATGWTVTEVVLPDPPARDGLPAANAGYYPDRNGRTLTYWTGEAWDDSKVVDYIASQPVRDEAEDPALQEAPSETRDRFDDFLDRLEAFKDAIRAGIDAQCPLQDEGPYFTNKRSAGTDTLMGHFEDRAPTVRSRSVAYRSGDSDFAKVYARHQARTVFNESQLGSRATMAFLLRMSHESPTTPWHPTIDDERFDAALTLHAYGLARQEAHFLWRWIIGHEPPPGYLGDPGEI